MDTLFSDDRIIAIWQRHDKVVALGGFRGRLDLFIAGILVPKPDIITDTLFEQIDILKYEADLFHQISAFHLPDIHRSNGNSALIHIEKTRDEMGNRTFSTAGRTYNRCYFALPCMEAHIGNCLFFFVFLIGEGYILKLDIIASRCFRNRRLFKLRLSQNLIHCLYTVGNPHGVGVDIHDFGKDARNGRYKYQIKDKARSKILKIPGIHADQNPYRQKEKINVVDNRHKGGHHVFPAQRIWNDHRSIFFDGLVQPVKGINSLLERFDD